MTMPMFPGYPHAVVKDNFVVEIIYVSEEPNSLEKQIKKFGQYDNIISFNEYGEYISIGAYVLPDGFVAGLSPYPSWTWDNTSREWVPPVKKPTQKNKVDFFWNEDILSWEECKTCKDPQEKEYYLSYKKDLNIDLISKENTDFKNSNLREVKKEKTNAN